jgi:hypothetical protein
MAMHSRQHEGVCTTGREHIFVHHHGCWVGRRVVEQQPHYAQISPLRSQM